MKSFVYWWFIILTIGGIVLADENYVTVYNQNLALVKQVRTVEITRSNLPLKFTDVAAKIIPTSVHLRNLSGNQDFTILEQNFEYDLVSGEKILDKYIDHEVEIITDRGQLISGILLSKSGRSLVLKTDDGIRILPLNDKMQINVKDLPEGLITRPTLIWEVAGVKNGKEKLEVSYLTEGMNWHAEYVGVLNENATQLGLDAWVSVENQSGATFQDARLKLVAGEIHRAPSPQIQEYAMEAMAPAYKRTGRQKGFQERSFFEYHIYELQRPTTLKNNQIKQISLFPAATVKCHKEFVYSPWRDSENIFVKLAFENKKSQGLGIPLPAGIFRIYKKDQESLEFIGEDRIDHTPRNESVKVTMGKAFDLKAERKVVTTTKISDRSQKMTVEIELRNHKEKEAVTILVDERMPAIQWKISDSNFSYKKIDVTRVEFNVPVPANDKVKLRYTVVYSW